jgi:hypothetical protein
MVMIVVIVLGVRVAVMVMIGGGHFISLEGAPKINWVPLRRQREYNYEARRR